MNNKTEVMYRTMPPWRLFFIVAIPGMVSMFAMSVYSVIEGAFLGQKLGEGAFAAVNIAMPLVMINFSLADLIGVGASVPISIALGKEEHKTANNVFSASVVMIFITSLVMGSIMYIFAEPLCAMMGAKGTLLETSVRYLRTCALCSPLASIFFAMDNYLRISGYVRMSMVINIVSNIATIGLLAFFLIVLEMDVVGSALAVSLSMCICSVIAMIPFVRRKTLLQFTKPHFEGKMFREIAACGSPVFLNNVSGRITSVLLNISLITLGESALGTNGGTTAVAVYAVLMYASDLCWPLLYGISDSLSPSVGYNWGAGNYGRVKKIIKCNYIGTAIVGFASVLAMLFLSEPIVSIFAKREDALLFELSLGAIRLFGLAYLFRWFGVTTQSFFSAIEKPAFATVVSVCTAFVFPVLSLGALWWLGLDGIWLNFTVTTALAATLAAILLAVVLKEIKKREAQKHEEATEALNREAVSA